MSYKLSESSLPGNATPKKEKFWVKIHNKEDGTCLERTWKHLMVLIIYVLIFTAFIVGVSVAMVYIALIYMVQESHPFFEMTFGEIDPGLSFFPNINEHSPIVWYARGIESSKQPEEYQNNIEMYLDKYTSEYEHKPDSGEELQYVDCDDFSISSLKKEEVCHFYRSNLQDCSKDGYGYDEDEPCIYLKINKVPTWTPEYYSKKLPSAMPKSLKSIIKKNQKKEVLWVSCVGKRPSDSDNIGSITYYPHQGFSGLFFPFKSVEDYISPLVAVKFTNITKLYLVSLDCSIWAKNFRDNHLLVQIFIDD